MRENTGAASGGRFDAAGRGRGKARRRTGRIWKILLSLFLICVSLYLIGSYSQIPFIKNTRDTIIGTAWETMRHRWIMKVFPPSVYKEVIARAQAAQNAQENWNTDVSLVASDDWLDDFTPYGSDTDWLSKVNLDKLDPEIRDLPEDQRYFYTLFYELDRDSVEKYLDEHPSARENGYDHIDINETELDGNGTSMRTRLGEKVLAIDAENQILILEVDAAGSRGVLAIAKDATKLHLCPASNIGAYGEHAGSIAKRNNGVLAMTGSGFIDNGGVGNGGDLAGFCMCGGKSYGEHYEEWGYKRIELHEDNWFYVARAHESCGEGTTDAVEFKPALVVNGEKMDPDGWDGQNPRACIGQSSRSEILMLVVEGRRALSLGCSVEVCADIFLAHGAITGLNMDGGSTAIMWYKGAYINHCSNNIYEGRHLPNAWVITK